MLLYFIRSTEGPRRIKIGISQGFDGRLYTIRCDSPVDVEVLKLFPGSRELEAELHSEFEDYLHHGEWFDLPETKLTEVLSRLDREFNPENYKV